uniref:Uncharacterized protein n=1 Tax=Lepeophtheirus salmonis TaxID=72036 RepID=A0A0K2UCW2_LEPSM
MLQSSLVYPHRLLLLRSPKEKSLKCDAQGQNVKLIDHQNDVPISPLLHALCGKWYRLVGTKYCGDHVLQFEAPKIVDSESRLCGP